MFGIAALGARKELDELAMTRAYTRLGEVLGLDWAQQQVARYMPTDNWERLLAAGLMRDFEQVRIDFLSRTRSEEPDESVERWVERNPKRIAQFRALVDRAKLAGSVSRADAGADRQPGADPAFPLVRAAILTPAPDYPEDWDWAYDVEAAVLLRAGFEVEPRPWTEPGDLDGFDLVMPLVAWGYHLDPPRWHALLDRLERERIRRL